MKSVIAKTFITRIEAELAKGYLDANGIKSIVAADDEGGAYPYPMSPTTSGVKLLADWSDYKKAVKLLDKVK